MEINPAQVEGLETRMRVIEVVLWGLDGNNGVRSEVRATREAVTALNDKFDAKIEELVKAGERKAAVKNAQKREQVMWAIGLVVMLIGAVIGALAIILTQH